MMKKILSSILFISLIGNIYSQGPGHRREIEKRYHAQKIAFITDEMQLSPEEAQLFWPIYNQFQTKKDSLMDLMHDYRADFPQDENELSEEQALTILKYFNKHASDMLKLNQTYQKKFLKVISAKKLLLLNNAENGFRRHLLQEFRGRGSNRK
jgi:hypothetical protein